MTLRTKLPLLAPRILSGGVLVLVALAACSPKEANHLSNQDSLQGPPIAIQPIWKSPDSLGLSGKPAVAIDGRGRVFIGDRSQGTIFVLDALDGNVIGRIGRPGEGPGEFRSVRSIQVGRGDTLWVFDSRLARLTAFEPDSFSPISSTRVPASVQGFPAAVWRTTNGQFVGEYVAPYSPGDSARAQRRTVVTLLDVDGNVLRDTLVSFPPADVFVLRTATSVTVMGDPFGRAPAIALSPRDRIFYAWTDTVGVTVFDLEGQPQATFGHPFAQSPITTEDIDRSMSNISGPHRQSFALLIKEASHSKWPSVESMVIDNHERIWLGLVQESGVVHDWVAFDEAGNPIGHITLPESSALRAVKDSLILSVDVDEDGVPVVVASKAPALGGQP